MRLNVLKPNRVQEIAEECLYDAKPICSGLTHLGAVVRILWYVADICSVANNRRFTPHRQAYQKLCTRCQVLGDNYYSNDLSLGRSKEIFCSKVDHWNI